MAVLRRIAFPPGAAAEALREGDLAVTWIWDTYGAPRACRVGPCLLRRSRLRGPGRPGSSGRR